MGGNMDIETESFRWGLEHLSPTDSAWVELQEVLHSINREEIVREKHCSFDEWRRGSIRTPRVGGQDLINGLIKARLVELNWESQIFVLDLPKTEINQLETETFGPKEKKKSETKKVSYWTMDFKKGDIGVEVSFNNAGVLAQNLLRLSVMSESYLKKKEEKIRLGILITAQENLKKWSNMDSTVLTFETVKRVFPLINFNIPTPIVLVGLSSSTGGEVWEASQYFGHKSLDPYDKLSDVEREIWKKVIDSEEIL